MANHMDTTSLAEQLGRLMADAGLQGVPWEQRQEIRGRLRRAMCL